MTAFVHTEESPAAGRCSRCGTRLPAAVLPGLCPICLLRTGAAAETEGVALRLPAAPPDPAEVARLFPQWEVRDLLGRGGVGSVFRVRQPALDRIVALKLLSLASAAPGFRDRFDREARALARLAHPNIVGVHEFGEVPGYLFLVMEFVDGVTLRQLESAGRLSPREALRIIPQLCDALQYAHDQGVVHRDIKPENVLVDRAGRVKVADFGLAMLADGGARELRLTRGGEVMGTPNYMAPEQVERPQAVDHRADIFSLGVVFYELLTGELPLGRFPPPSQRVEVDVRIDDVVLRSLEKEPVRRYQRAGDLKTDVERLGSPPVERPGKAGLARRWPWAVPAGIVAGVALGLALGLSPSLRKGSPVPDAGSGAAIEGASSPVDAASGREPRWESLSPVVVATDPASGSRGVAPGVREIRVTFSRPMAPRSWTWAEPWPGANPEAVGEPRFDPDGLTCRLAVRLVAGRTYAYWLNTERFRNFSDPEGVPAVPYLLVFETAAAEDAP